MRDKLTGKSFLKHDLVVHSYEVGFNRSLSLPALFGYFQEIAWEHATQNDFGWENLLEKNAFWALSRVKVEIAHLPKWTEKLELYTWPSGVDGLFALRDFLLYNERGELLVSASSSWLIVDIKSRRPHRLDSFKRNFPINDQIRALKENAGKVAAPSGSSFSEIQVKVCQGDIDVNGHTNNMRYVEWVMNAFPLEFQKEFEPKTFEINFLHEGMEGDSCLIQSFKESSNSFIGAICNTNTQKELARTHVIWQPINNC
ncbi:MAG: hypothetical protein JW783_04410 [Bacteroidales bacterium]|nr:hypothetical protein [Bacteroidales bacterium]MBN2749133.1 hypothetical protein [Bacteroidales bacterium]